MKFIPQDKYSILKERANGGDETAKNFLFDFMNMDEEKVNEYLATVGASEQNALDGIDFLVKDENEAIDGYDKQIKIIQNSGLPEESKVVIINTLQHIKEEELEHIEELKEIKNGLDKEQKSFCYFNAK